jgi:hypothetical protein
MGAFFRLYSVTKSRGAKSEPQHGLPRGHFLPIKNNDLVGPSIAVLLKPGCPAAIFLAVSKVVVDSVNRHPAWAFPHVFQKFFKFQPAIAHIDPAPTISHKIARIWVAASRDDSSPDFVSRGFAHAMSAAVFTVSHGVPKKASAGLCIARLKAVLSCLYNVSAIALRDTHINLYRSTAFSHALERLHMVFDRKPSMFAAYLDGISVRHRY